MKTRLDTLLFERGLAKSREQARALILAGEVIVGGERAGKAGQAVDEGAQISVRESACPFVSRGGFKLQKALAVFPLSLEGAWAADIGASTGGFTDCMLKNGAARVYAIDVGYGQLDWTLRNDPRVVVRERVNARFIEPAWFERALDFASIDVSFISLDKILPPLFACLKEGASVVALVKPQFEAGRGKVGRHGVVSDADTHVEVIERVCAVARGAGFSLEGLSYSPIRGPKGNIEFLLWLAKCIPGTFDDARITRETTVSVVAEAHNTCI